MNRMFTLILAIGFYPIFLSAQISTHSIQIRTLDPGTFFGVYVDERKVSKGSLVAQGCISFSKLQSPNLPPNEELAQMEYEVSYCLGWVSFDVYLVEKGDYFTVSTIDAGHFEPIGNRQVLPERFILAFAGPTIPVPEETREHFGWVEIALQDGRHTIIDQAMAYKSPGIVIGSTATEPEPEPIELSIRRAVGIQFQTKAGVTYQMFASSDGTNWQVEGKTFEGTGEIFERFFPANKTATFYRVEEVLD